MNPNKQLPASNQIVEMLANAPDILTLQYLVVLLDREFPHAPREWKDRWRKCADDIVLAFIRNAPHPRDVAFLVTVTFTAHQWPTTEQGRARIRRAAEVRWTALGTTFVPLAP